MQMQKIILSSAAIDFCTHLANHHTVLFLYAAKQACISLINKIDAVSATGTWEAANILLTVCCTITKHLSVALGGRVIVPEKLVTSLGS